jgi:hypothetical protein
MEGKGNGRTRLSSVLTGKELAELCASSLDSGLREVLLDETQELNAELRQYSVNRDNVNFNLSKIEAGEGGTRGGNCPSSTSNAWQRIVLTG